MKTPVIHLVGQRLTPELVAIVRGLREMAVVYHFATTRELIAAWRLAQRNDAADCVAPTAVVWLQTRAGEFRQREIDVVAECDPLAKGIVIAGVWSEGEPRSGKPLTGASRVYWHQGIGAIVPSLARQSSPPRVAPQWAAIHARQLVDYQGLAAACNATGLQTIWQNDRWPAICSEPALRLFQEWDSWQAWREQTGPARGSRAKEVLLLSFPRPTDFERAAANGISGVLAQPFTAADLQRALVSVKKEPRRSTIPFAPAVSSAPVVRQLQSA